MASAPNLEERAALALQAAVDKAQALSRQAGQHVAAWSGRSEGGERPPSEAGQALAKQAEQALAALAKHAEQAAILLVHWSSQARQTVAAGFGRSAELAAEASGRLAAELRPAAERCWEGLLRRLEELRNAEALQLRQPDDVPSFGDDLARLSGSLGDLATALQHLPTPAVVALAVVGLRLAAAANAWLDAAAAALLRGRSAAARLGLLAALAPGLLAAGACRGALLQDWPQGRDREAARLEAAAALARSARRLPGAFWLVTCITATVVLHAAREAGVWALGLALRARLAAVLAAGAACAVAGGTGKEHVQQALGRLSEALPPEVLKLVHTAWYQVQAASRKAFERPRESLSISPPSSSSHCVDAAPQTLLTPGSAMSTPRQTGPVFHGQNYSNSDIID